MGCVDPLQIRGLHCSPPVEIAVRVRTRTALLNTLDDALFSRGEDEGAGLFLTAVGKGLTKANLCTITAACWIICLVSSSGAPAICTAMSTASILGALVITTAEEQAQWLILNLQVVAITTFLTVMFLLTGPSAKTFKQAGFWVFWLLLWQGVGRFAGSRQVGVRLLHGLPLQRRFRRAEGHDSRAREEGVSVAMHKGFMSRPTAWHMRGRR